MSLQPPRIDSNRQLPARVMARAPGLHGAWLFGVGCLALLVLVAALALVRSPSGAAHPVPAPVIAPVFIVPTPAPVASAVPTVAPTAPPADPRPAQPVASDCSWSTVDGVTHMVCHNSFGP